ncbi:MAG: recombinase family protein [Firmicutes bacterium]|nr:recombinase family protein [Bacillota bacterium]
MIENEKKIVAIYTRVSTNDQAREGHSLEEQERRLRARCEADGYEIYKVYTDAGISGKSTENRPQYQQMLKDMKKGKFNLIMAFKLDRISRSIVDFEIFFNELKKNNCGIELLCEKIDTSGAAGMMFARILGIFAQFERELIKERTLVGVESAVNKGHFGGRPPLGYKHKLDESGKKKLKEWEIDEEEAKIIREIFDLCSNGKTYFQISNILKEKYPNVISYIKTDKKTDEKTTIYRQWTDGSISRILNNKSYIGIYEHRKSVKDKDTVEISGVIPSIISEEQFYECQNNIKKNMRNYYRSKSYLFMQKLVCPNCGRILGCNGTKKPNGVDYRYYKCISCSSYIREELIEKSLIKKLNDLLELSYIINDNYIAVDKQMAEDFNNCRLNHRIRFAMDENIIKKIKNDYNADLNEIWNIASYEAKCNFIQEYVDCITIEPIKNKRNCITQVKAVDLKLKKTRIQKIFELKDNNMLDEILGEDKSKFSNAFFKKEDDALEYIELLRKKYKFDVLEVKPDDFDAFFWDISLFKLINIKPTKAIEKKKTLCLYLADI